MTITEIHEFLQARAVEVARQIGREDQDAVNLIARLGDQMFQLGADYGRETTNEQSS